MLALTGCSHGLLPQQVPLPFFMTLGITYGITTYNHFVIGSRVHFHIKGYLTDNIHFDSQRLSRVSTMFKLHGVNWVKKQKY